MAGTLFDSIIFGPLSSRRLGTSLGINLLPTTIKFCSFNCIYCECGWTETNSIEKAQLYTAKEISTSLEERLIYLKEQNITLDSLTFAGNGEPTMHPQFVEIIEDTIRLRDLFALNSKISVLSNSTMLAKPHVIEALVKVNNIMKLDAGSEQMFKLINKPKNRITLDEIVEQLKKFQGQLNIQSMFVRGEMEGVAIDNTIDSEIEAWLKHLVAIQPKEVMIYSLDRRPPLALLEKIMEPQLEGIAERVRQLNIKASVY